MAGVLSQARKVVPRYGIAEPASNADVQRLLDAFRIRVRHLEGLSVAAFILPPDEEGWYGLRMRADIGGGVRRFFLLHDVAHVIAGEALEPTWEDFDDPYPHFERRADIFAAMGVLHARDRAAPPEWIEQRLWQEVPSDARAWKYRVPEIAKALTQYEGEEEIEWLE